MKAIIFAAGLGSRFKPWTDHHPKALAVINGKTLLQRNIEYLQCYNIIDVVVNVHHFASQIIETIDKNKGWGSNIMVSDETAAVLETGGGLLHAAPLLQNSGPFLSLNVDVLTDIDIVQLQNKYEQENAFIAFGVSKRKTSRNILLDNQMQMCGWENTLTGEIKKVKEADAYLPYAYSCVTIYNENIFTAIKQSGKFSIMESFLDLASTQKIVGNLHEDNKWIDVGKPEAVNRAEAIFK